MDEEVKFIFGRLKWRRLGIMSSICDYIVYMGWVGKVGYYIVHLWLYSIYGLSVEDSFTFIYIYIYIWVNCKLHPWSLELFGFYTPKFQKFDFTPWSLVPLTIHTLQLVFAVNWHITILTCFIFAKSGQKFVKNNGRLGTIETVQFCPNLKHKT